MTVTMMRVGIVSMSVFQRLVNVGVRVRFGTVPFSTVRVTVVFVMRMRVRVV